MSVLRVVNWNVAWARSNSRRAGILRDRIFEHDPHIVCVTEAYVDFLPTDGHMIAPDADYGYEGVPPGRRKVVLWSRSPWFDADPIGRADIPTGRYIAGVTDTPIGPLHCRGVCIPWADAHVRTGRRDRQRWEDHETYLRGLREVLAQRNALPQIVVGDYNQRVPRKYQPERMYKALRAALSGHFTIGTSGTIDGIGKAAIDHVAFSPELTVASVRGLSNESEAVKQLSDHFGLYVELERSEQR